MVTLLYNSGKHPSILANKFKQNLSAYIFVIILVNIVLNFSRILCPLISKTNIDAFMFQLRLYQWSIITSFWILLLPFGIIPSC